MLILPVNIISWYPLWSGTCIYSASTPDILEISEKGKAYAKESRLINKIIIDKPYIYFYLLSIHPIYFGHYFGHFSGI